MKFIKCFVFFVVVLTACKTKKNLMDSNVLVEEMSAKKIARKHVAANFNKKTIDAKLKASFNNSKLKQTFSVSFKVKRDEVIWLKGTKFITLFKAKITPTSVQFYSSLNKTYFDGDFSMLKKILGTDINFNQLQNLLLGQSLLNVKKKKQEVIIENNSYVLSPNEQEKLFDIFFSVNPSHFKLNKQSIVNSKKKQRLDVLYPSYNIFAGVVFPTEIKIKAKQPGSFTNIDFTLKSVQFDTDVNTSFSIPKGYKQIKI